MRQQPSAVSFAKYQRHVPGEEQYLFSFVVCLECSEVEYEKDFIFAEYTGGFLMILLPDDTCGLTSGHNPLEVFANGLPPMQEFVRERVDIGDIFRQGFHIAVRVTTAPSSLDLLFKVNQGFNLFLCHNCKVFNDLTLLNLRLHQRIHRFLHPGIHGYIM